MPVDQLPSVIKLYDLEPLRACALFAGASRIGSTTIWNLVETFKAQQDVKNRKSTYTMKWLAEKLGAFVDAIYQREIPNAWMRPMMEIILSGYSARHREPELWRLTLSYDRSTTQFKCDIQNPVPRGQFNVIFGGQYDVIQRVVNGIDLPSYFSLRQRTVQALDQYHDEKSAKERFGPLDRSVGNSPYFKFSYGNLTLNQMLASDTDPVCGGFYCASDAPDLRFRNHRFQNTAFRFKNHR
jgi:hypothetical protein